MVSCHGLAGGNWLTAGLRDRMGDNVGFFAPPPGESGMVVATLFIVRWARADTALAVASGALASGVGYALWYAALRGLSATCRDQQVALPPVFAASALYDSLLQAALRQFFDRATFETEPIPSLSSDGRLAIEPTNDPSVLSIRWFGSRHVLHVPARRPVSGSKSPARMRVRKGSA